MSSDVCVSNYLAVHRYRLMYIKLIPRQSNIKTKLVEPEKDKAVGARGAGYCEGRCAAMYRSLSERAMARGYGAR